MSGKKMTPDQSAHAVVLREAGYTISAIADRLDISVSTTQRILRANKAVAGAATAAVVAKAREEMLKTSFAMDEIQLTAAAMIVDDLSIAQRIREKLSMALEMLDPGNPVVFRSLAAGSTSLKLTQDVWRRALPMERLEETLDVEQLPELKIHIMTEHDVAVMRAEQRREDAELNGDAQGIEDEDETLRWLADRRAVQMDPLADDDVVIIEGDSRLTGH